MSDFDKEAERQKLREKYERDTEKRKSTQRMSELLLKGATMTNRHCDQCGDPIFRYDGEEFCPSCQNAQVGAGEEATGGQQAADGQQATGGQQAAGDAAATGSGEAGTTGGGTETVADAVPTDAATEGDSAANGARNVDVAVQSGESQREQGTGSRAERATADARQPPVRTTTDDAQTDAVTDATGAGDLADARASLQRSVVRFAREAEAADDPRRARDLLAASREAAEALAALNR